MELLLRFGTKKQREQWLEPLLDGSIRSAFAMTEPAFASSDATNIATSLSRAPDGSHYILNGRKWWTSGAMDSRCKVLFVLARGPSANSRTARHEQHSILIVPMSSPGVRALRPLTVFGYDDAPHGHAEVLFVNVAVPVADSILLAEGAGFKAAQSRLGAGRLHHCMRLVGVGERALEMLIDRADSRTAFGKKLSAMGGTADVIAKCRCDVECCRLLVKTAAEAADAGNAGEVKKWVGIAKIRVPQLVCDVIDCAMQIHGGGGLSGDFPLAQMYAQARALRLADGPDEVHRARLARQEVRSRREKLARL